MATNSSFVYILSSRRGTLYTGVTNDLARRMHEHRSHALPGFASRYRIDRLIYFEETSDIDEALTREKQVKAWPRKQKPPIGAYAEPEVSGSVERLRGRMISAGHSAPTRAPMAPSPSTCHSRPALTPSKGGPWNRWNAARTACSGVRNQPRSHVVGTRISLPAASSAGVASWRFHAPRRPVRSECSGLE